MRNFKLNLGQQNLLEILQASPNREFTIKSLMRITGKEYFSLLGWANALYLKVERVEVYKKRVENRKKLIVVYRK